MLSLNYGELPTRQQFRAHYKEALSEEYPDSDAFIWADEESGTYQMHLKGEDADCAMRWTNGISRGNNYYDMNEMWHIVVELHTAWERGAECAGDLASSILYTLEIEWI